MYYEEIEKKIVKLNKPYNVQTNPALFLLPLCNKGPGKEGFFSKEAYFSPQHSTGEAVNPSRYGYPVSQQLLVTCCIVIKRIEKQTEMECCLNGLRYNAMN